MSTHAARSRPNAEGAPSCSPDSETVSSRVILRASRPELLWTRVGGMLIIERQLFVIARAGLRSVVLVSRAPKPAAIAALRIPLGLEFDWVDPGDKVLSERGQPRLEISGDHLIRPEALAAVASRRFSAAASFEDRSGFEVVRIVPAGEDSIRRAGQALAEGSCLCIGAPIVRGAISDWLMAAGPKPQDGFMARHFDRRLSLAVSRALLDTAVTPNQMTVFSSILGVIGASFFLGDARLFYVAGALLIWLHSVLDGCDGELARIRFQESVFGSDLDFWGDNLVHLALFSFLGIGFWSTGNGVHTLILAVVADLGVLASAWTAWGRRRARRGDLEPGVVDELSGNGFGSKLARLENALAQRDFIYLLVGLSFVDMVYEFLWAAAIGGLLYFGIMLYLGRANEREKARRPHAR